MIEAIMDNLYKIEIPLPGNPLKVLNSYFIRGTERNLLIDTGFNQPECLAAMQEAMEKLDFNMENTDLFITHVHSDHSGLVGALQTEHTKVYCSRYTSYTFSEESYKLWEHYDEMIRQSGLPPIDIKKHPGYSYSSTRAKNLVIVEDGTRLNIGTFNLTCVETSGHAPQHICLYEADKKILFAGDHILSKITPNNTIWEAPWQIKTDSLGEYLDNLDKVDALDIDLVLVAHRDLVSDCKKRTQELRVHHQRRLENVMEILEGESRNGAQVASLMQWDVTKEWENFSDAQKIFATGEALAHLTHLLYKKALVAELRDGVVYYAQNPVLVSTAVTL